MIELKCGPNDRILELGGGANRHPQCHVNVDVRPAPGVDFTADFDKPLPMKDDEWDGVFSQYVIEHLSWRNVRDFVKEVFRITKPGGRVCFVTANTEEQIKWIYANPLGWDGKPIFESASCVLFGDQDYPENTHKNYMTSQVATDLFRDAGFDGIVTQPYGERRTDMAITAIKPKTSLSAYGAVASGSLEIGRVHPASAAAVEAMKKSILNPSVGDRAALFDKHYFNGGGKVGGYAREGYWDYPVHEITVQHILARKPESVFELGCARGYLLKRLQDRGIPAGGFEISKHCYMTRVADNIRLFDVCKTPWNMSLNGGSFDLAFSIATFEHIPIEYLGDVLGELNKYTKRGLHGIDFGRNDDGFDKTHCSLRPKEWWRELFDHYGLQSHEIVDKEELEKGNFPEDVLKGDGKVKLNVGSFTTMYHYGWTNIDLHDLAGFAQQCGYKYQRHDVKTGLPYNTGAVDMIHASHFFEHLTYQEGIAFLRECRRVLKSDGMIRIAVPDAELLMDTYDWSFRDSDYRKDHLRLSAYSLDEFGEINDGCSATRTPAAKLWSLLHEGHSACYDADTLCDALGQAGFVPVLSSFRSEGTSTGETRQFLAETLDMFPCLSLYAWGFTH